MNHLIKTIFLTLTFILLLGSSQAGAEGGGSDSTADHTGANWLRFSASGLKIVPKDIDISSDIYVTNGVTVVTINLDAGATFVRCCKPHHSEHAWCDLNLQDKRC